MARGSWWALVALGVVIAQLGAQLAWIARDHSPLGYEVPEHWLAAEEIAADLRDTRRDGGSLVQCVLRHRQLGHRATGVHLYAAAWLAVAPGDRSMLVGATWTLGAACVIALAWGAYGLARALAGPEAGAIAAVGLVLAPPVWGFGRVLGVDLPLAACVLVAARSLVASPPWSRPRAAFRLGLVCGVGCLVKAQLVLWLAGLVVPAWIVARRSGLGGRAWLASALAWAVALALGSAFFWAGATEEILADARWSVAGPHTEVPAWDAAALGYYPLGLWAWSGPALGTLGLVGLGAWGFDAARRPRSVPPAAWILVAGAACGLLWWTAYPIKWVRYALPVLPLAAVLAAAGLMRLPGRVRRTLLALAFAVATAIEVMSSTGIDLPLPAPEPAVLCHPPESRDWRPGVSALAAKLGVIPPGAAIGLVGPADWPSDLYTLLEAHLRPHVPASAEFFRASDVRDPDDLVRFERAAAGFAAEVHVLRDPDAILARHGWRRVGPFTVYEVDVPDASLVLVGWRRDVD